MIIDEIVPWRMYTARAAEPGRATPTLKHNNNQNLEFTIEAKRKQLKR